MDIMEQIQEEMSRQGISIWRLSKMLELSEQAVYRWFRYEQNPTLSHLIDIAWVLGCEIELKKIEEQNNG